MVEHPSQRQDDPEAHREAMYHRGTTSVFASKADPRFSFSLYVPPEAGPETTLLVSVHGTGRRMFEMRDAFAEFGRYNNCLVLAPLFPIGPFGDDYGDGYKQMKERDIRYDRVLLAMIDEVGGRYKVPSEKFLLYGYSGGGHFTHRFLYLHPTRLRAASIGAPGSVTLPDREYDYWVGCRDFETVFGQPFEIEAIRRVPVHLVVGGADLETWEITHKPGGKHWMEGANRAGKTRPERITTLRDALAGLGVKTRLDVIPGMAHDNKKAVPKVKDFFLDVLNGRFP